MDGMKGFFTLQQSNIKKRWELLDVIRGFLIFAMVIYHAIFDLKQFYFNFDFIDSNGSLLVLFRILDICQYIGSALFIFLSGICRAIGKKSLQRGLVILACSCIINVATAIFTPDIKVIFGILTFMGSAMLFLIPLEKLFDKINPALGMSICFVCFILCQNIENHSIGLGSWCMIRVPDWLYRNTFTAFWGFPNWEFESGDYFPFFPWIFLFTAGFFFWKLWGNKLKTKRIMHFNVKFLTLIGRNSLLIYMLHQPILFAILQIAQYFTVKD